MLQTALIPNAHKDLVTSATYNYYGTSLATCSLDQRICIWSLDEQTSQWQLQDEWKAHDAPVAHIAWAHPEFGDVIASAGFDRTVKIWERSSSSGWVEKAVLLDARASVRQVEFAPNAFGLRLATISTDGMLRIYDCLEQNRLDAWLLSEQLDPCPAPPDANLNPSREANGGWSISWCKDRYWGQLIACASGIKASVSIIQFSPSQSPQTILRLEPPIPDTVTTVSWAPGCGKSYHLLATGGRDGHVRIWKLFTDNEDASWTSQLVADFDDHVQEAHGGTVGKVEWNLTGTLLSSTGSDGRVRLWKATSSLGLGGRIWRSAGSIGVEQQPQQMDES